jgi:hypothetical protein
MLRVVTLFAILAALLAGQGHASAHGVSHPPTSNGLVGASALVGTSGVDVDQDDHDGCPVSGPCCCAFCGVTVAVVPGDTAAVQVIERSTRAPYLGEHHRRSIPLKRDPPVPKARPSA